MEYIKSVTDLSLLEQVIERVDKGIISFNKVDKFSLTYIQLHSFCLYVYLDEIPYIKEKKKNLQKTNKQKAHNKNKPTTATKLKTLLMFTQINLCKGIYVITLIA